MKQKKMGAAPMLRKQATATLGRLCFVQPKSAVEKAKKAPPPKVKNDPALVAKARELKDRWLERVNADPSVLISSGKYEVGRPLHAPPSQIPQRLLSDAA